MSRYSPSVLPESADATYAIGDRIAAALGQYAAYKQHEEDQQHADRWRTVEAGGTVDPLPAPTTFGSRLHDALARVRHPFGGAGGGLSQTPPFVPPSAPPVGMTPSARPDMTLSALPSVPPPPHGVPGAFNVASGAFEPATPTATPPALAMPQMPSAPMQRPQMQRSSMQPPAPMQRPAMQPPAMQPPAAPMDTQMPQLPHRPTWAEVQAQLPALETQDVAPGMHLPTRASQEARAFALQGIEGDYQAAVGAFTHARDRGEHLTDTQSDQQFTLGRDAAAQRNARELEAMRAASAARVARIGADAREYGVDHRVGGNGAVAVNRLGTRYDNDPVIKNAKAVAESLVSLRAAANGRPTPQSDQALIYGFMKMLDEKTGVREGEYASAQNAAAIDDRIRNLYNSTLKGHLLTPEQRQEILVQAEAKARGVQSLVHGTQARYGPMARSVGADSALVAYDPLDGALPGGPRAPLSPNEKARAQSDPTFAQFLTTKGYQAGDWR